MEHVKIKDKILYTFEEASEISNIGINRLRHLANDNEEFNLKCIINVGSNKKLIKAQPFKEWINKSTMI